MFTHISPRRGVLMHKVFTQRVAVLFALSFLLSITCGMVAKTYTVTTTNDFGYGSLRDAIQKANASSCETTINFALTTSDPGYNCTTKSWSIVLANALPVIQELVFINGFSQLGSWPNSAAIDQENNAHIAVEISCALADPNGTVCPFSGLTFGSGSDGSCIRGLAINGFDRGLDIESNNVRVSGMFLGVAVDGVTPKLNTVSLYIGQNATGTQVGGCKPKQRNLIAGTGQSPVTAAAGQTLGAITIFGSQSSIQLTTVNLTRAGNALITSGALYGIVSIENEGTLVGGPQSSQRVVVSGHVNANIHVDNTVGDTFANVLAGTSADGLTALGGGSGICFVNQTGVKKARAQGTLYTHTITNSVFSGHSDSGIILGQEGDLFPVDQTYIGSSFTGTDITGTTAMPNGTHGILIANATGTWMEQSVLAYNTHNGVYQRGSSGTVLSTCNSNFNEKGGIKIESSSPAHDDSGYAVLLQGCTGTGNGGNALVTPDFLLESL